MRRVWLTAWCALAGAGASLAIFQRDLVVREVHGVLGGPLLAAGLVYLLLGAIRGFTFVPSTYLVMAAVPFFPPVPLLLLTIAGIAMSSTCIYVWSEALRLGEFFERRHARQVARLRDVLTRHEWPLIVGWSFFPLAPTDLIVYVCGALRISFAKCVIGVCLGEGGICAIYIFCGDYLLRLAHWR